jgi:hypothetical protein
MKTIKTMTLSVSLAAVFLSAGAFAHVTTPVTAPANPVIEANVTIVHKNSQWPKLVKLNPCDLRRCVEV